MITYYYRKALINKNKTTKLFCNLKFNIQKYLKWQMQRLKEKKIQRKKKEHFNVLLNKIKKISL